MEESRILINQHLGNGCFLYVWRRDVNRSNVKRNDVKQSTLKSQRKTITSRKAGKKYEAYKQSLWTEQEIPDEFAASLEALSFSF